jgi:hypothetical protein
MSDDVLTGASLEESLRSGDFDSPAADLVGMVKASDQKGYVSFTGSGCDHWVDIPTKMIEQAERVGSSKCKDHSHPIFKLKLKVTQSGEAQVLSALLAQRSAVRQFPIQSPQSAEFPQMARRGPRGGPPGGGVYVGPTSVGYWPTGDGRWVCAGWEDCLNLAGAIRCAHWECTTGWVTGDPVCWCTPA